MIDVSSLPHGHAIWTYVHADGTNLHLDVTGLRAKFLLNPAFDHKVFDLPLSLDLAKDYIRNNIVSLTRIEELAKRYSQTEPKRIEPILLCDSTKEDTDVYHVDGHHRYVLWALLKVPSIRALCIPYDLWQPFRVIGLPPLTQDALRAMPITKRNY